MSSEQILALIRTVLKFVGGILVSSGYFDASTLAQLVGGAMALIATVWSMYIHAPVTVPPETPTSGTLGG